MLSFEPSKEIEKDVFSSCVGQRKKFWIPMSNRPSARISIRILLGFLSLCRAQNLPSFLFYLQNMTLTTLLILAVCRTCVIWTSLWALLTIESLWLSGRASKRGIRRSEVRFPYRDSDYYLCPTLVTKRKNIFLYMELLVVSYAMKRGQEPTSK